MDGSDDSTTVSDDLTPQELSTSMFIVQFQNRKRKWIPSKSALVSNTAFLNGLATFLETQKKLAVEYEDPDLKEFVEFERADQLPQKAVLKVVEKIETNNNNQQVVTTVQTDDERKIVNTFVSFKTAHGTYIRANPGGEGALINLHSEFKDWEKFFIQDVGNNEVAIKSFHGTYFRAFPGNEAKLDLQTQVGPWEKYRIKKDENLWTIQSVAHGTYIRALPGVGAKLDLKGWAKAWEHYELIQR